MYRVWQQNKMKPHPNEMFDCVQFHEKPAEPRGQRFGMCVCVVVAGGVG